MPGGHKHTHTHTSATTRHTHTHTETNHFEVADKAQQLLQGIKNGSIEERLKRAATFKFRAVNSDDSDLALGNDGRGGKQVDIIEAGAAKGKGRGESCCGLL